MQPPSPGPYDPDAETRRVNDGGQGSYPPGGQQGQPGPDAYPPSDAYPPTAAYPPGGGYGSGPYPPAGGDPNTGGYPPTGGYGQQGGYPSAQGGYDQGGGYDQSGGYGGYPAGGYQQGGYPPGGGYGGYPPGAPGGPGTPPSNGRRNLVIAGIVAAVLVVVAIPIILLTTSGDDDPDPRPTTALPTAPQTSASSSPSASPTPSQTPSQTPSSSPTPEGDELTVAQQQLQGQLDPNAMQDCLPYPEAEDSDIQAALTCVSEDGRPVVAYSFYDATAADNQAAYEASQVTGDTGDCEFAQADVTEWNYPEGGREGDLICSVSEDSFFIYWSYDADLLGFVAGDDLANGAALYEWWRQFEAVAQ